MGFGSIIATDLDGVLADVERSTQMKIWEKFNVMPRANKEHEFYMHDRYEGNEEIVDYARSLFSTPSFIESLPTFRENVRELKHWYDSCLVDQVYAITGRSNVVREATLSWLYHHGIPFSALITDATDKKGTFMFGLDCDFLIEDRLDEAEKVAALGMKIYLVERPYNIVGKETSPYKDKIIWVNNYLEIGRLENFNA